MAEAYTPVFLYLYTGMPDSIFEREDIGDLLNRHFINARFDTADNPDIATRFGADTIPVMMIVRSDGTLDHIITGGNLLNRLEEIIK